MEDPLFPPHLHKDSSSLSRTFSTKYQIFLNSKVPQNTGDLKGFAKILRPCKSHELKVLKGLQDEDNLLFSGDSFWQGAEERVENARAEDCKSQRLPFCLLQHILRSFYLDYFKHCAGLGLA